MRAPLLKNETTRLAALREYDILDTNPEDTYDDVVRLAAFICGTPISAVTLVDAERQWFKSILGLEVRETPRDLAFCAHTILQTDMLIVPDATQDERFADNPLVTDDPHVRFYAGVPLVTSGGQALGALCVVDTVPHTLSVEQRDALCTLTHQVMGQLELRRQTAAQARVITERDRALEEVRLSEARLNEAQGIAQVGNWEFEIPSGRIHWSEQQFRLFGLDPAGGEPSFEDILTRLHPDDVPMFRRLAEKAMRYGERHEADLRVMQSDGSARWAHLIGDAARDADGALVRLVGTLTDVTAQKQAQERDQGLLAATSALGVALTTAEVADVILQAALPIYEARMGLVALLSEDGQTLHATKIIGVSAEVADAWREFPTDAALPLTDAVRERRLICLASPEEHDAAYPDLALLRGQALAGSVVAVPLLVGERCLGGLGLICPPNRCPDLEQQTFLLTLAGQCALALERARLYDEARREVEERRRAQEGLRLRDRALSAAGSGIVICDVLQPDCPITYVNPAFTVITGYEAEEVIGRNCRFLQGPDTDAMQVEYIYDCLRDGQECQVILQNYKKDGTAFWNRLHISPVRDEAGEITHFIGIQQDVSELRQIQEALSESETNFRVITETIPAAIVIADSVRGTLFYANPYARSILGMSAEAKLTEYTAAAFYRDPQNRAEIIAELAQRPLVRREDIALRRVDGTLLWADGYLQRFNYGGREAILSTYQDVTIRKELEDVQARTLHEALQRADRDPLTNLLNHRAFHTQLAREAERALREGETLAVLVLDLDNFRFFNDVYGHTIGDEVLRGVASRLLAACGPNDFVARFGGDEFAMLLLDVRDGSAADVEARLRDEIGGFSFRAGSTEPAIPITVSLGAVLLPQDGSDWHQALQRADERLLWAKTGGDGKVQQVRADARERIQGFTMLDALVTAVDNKDRYTRKHSEDVMVYSLLIARELGLSDSEQQTIAVAALLHDVGKIGVPDAILRKPGQLTEDEFDAVKQHPMMGAIIVQAVPGLEQTLDAVRHHHERWDGMGYPFGLRAEETPLMARLMAVADAYSAMTTDRPYRKGMDPAKARAILDAGTGTQWDAECVRAFLRALPAL